MFAHDFVGHDEKAAIGNLLNMKLARMEDGRSQL